MGGAFSDLIWSVFDRVGGLWGAVFRGIVELWGSGVSVNFIGNQSKTPRKSSLFYFYLVISFNNICQSNLFLSCNIC